MRYDTFIPMFLGHLYSLFCECLSSLLCKLTIAERIPGPYVVWGKSYSTACFGKAEPVMTHSPREEEYLLTWLHLWRAAPCWLCALKCKSQFTALHACENLCTYSCWNHRVIESAWDHTYQHQIMCTVGNNQCLFHFSHAVPPCPLNQRTMMHKGR